MQNTDSYGLAVGMTTDDFVAPEHVDRPARTLDRVLGAIARRLLSAGVYESWELQDDKRVSAGAGLVNGAWGETGTAQSISGLTSGAVNYVFAVATEDTAPLGTVSFIAQLQAVTPPGALALGAITLDAQGAVTAVENAGDRGCFPLLSATLSGSGTVEDVGGGQQAVVEISHAAQAVPGAIVFTVSEHFTFALERTWKADGFRALIMNEDTEAHDLVYAWERRGIVG